MLDIHDLVKTPTGRRWLSTADEWADEPIRACPIRELRQFVINEIEDEDVDIDPRKIVGTSHASYNQGMTWRGFLSGGKRIGTKLEVLETKPEYYDDPKRHATDSEPWILDEIEDELFADIGTHRSVVAKFRAHEDGYTRQRVWAVHRHIVCRVAEARYNQLQKEYLPGERDSGPERELIEQIGNQKHYRIFVRCYLHGFDWSSHRLPVEDAVEFVRKRNRVSKAVLSFAPSLWRRIFRR